MTKGRLEAFSDGVIAILITIAVLELWAPEGADLVDLISVALVGAWLSLSLHVAVAVIRLVPDRRVEKVLGS